MIDTTRDLLISLSSHMAYMQGQLEARHELDDPDDFYWYRESVLLRQKVTDALADEPAVPEGREPVAVIGEPSDKRPTVMEIIELSSEIEAAGLGQVDFARAVLARWGNPAPVPPADGEVVELVAWLRSNALTVKKASGNPANGARQRMNRAAELLQRQVMVPVSVSERPPEDQLCWWFEPDEEDDEAYGSSWTLLRICGGTSSYTHWLPAHALPLPEVK